MDFSIRNIYFLLFSNCGNKLPGQICNKEIKFESSNKLYDYNVFTVFCLTIKVTRKYVGI